jgi:hypothetical protein
MQTVAERFPTRPDTDQHVLVVADWTVEPKGVIAALRRRADVRPTRWSLLVPAWLHGLDWAGDPHASGPCAQRALLTLRGVASHAGLDIDLAIVGDPDPVTAVNDTCAAASSCCGRASGSAGDPLPNAGQLRTPYAVT